MRPLLSTCITVLKRPLLQSAAIVAISIPFSVNADDRSLIEFETKQLSDVYFSEGAAAGDINGDGIDDVVCGPYWYQGPIFTEKHEIYKPIPQNRERYADNFFSWIYDFDGDGDNDVFAVGFCMTPAYVYENPASEQAGDASESSVWKKHQVIDWVSNESPQFTNLTGDATPELICTRDSFFGFATISSNDPLGEWDFHPISEQIAPKQFGHGLGVGDVNGDGLNDVIFAGGWFEQPSENATTSRWKLHQVSFSESYGGADMFAYDVDGDGLNDIITSHAAHDFGLGWYKQLRSGNDINFEHHLIMGDRPSKNKYGVVFSEPHSLALADVNGDGLKDIVTGKTYYSHHKQSPMWDAGAVVYWFQLVRNADGVDWVPHLAGSTSGIGRQVFAKDINNDGLLDFTVGGMLGTHVLIQSRKQVGEQQWLDAQPKPYVASDQRGDRGPIVQFGTDGQLGSATEGEAMKVVELMGGKTTVQDMRGFKDAVWSGGQQLFWTGGKPGDKLSLELSIPKSGDYSLASIFTTASDYAMIDVELDSEPLRKQIDLYDYPGVQTTGLLNLGERNLTAGNHTLTLEITGANASAKKAFMVGVDCVLVKPSR